MMDNVADAQTHKLYQIIHVCLRVHMHSPHVVGRCPLVCTPWSSVARTDTR